MSVYKTRADKQLCVKREMNSDLDIGWDADREAAEVIELNER